MGMRWLRESTKGLWLTLEGERGLLVTSEMGYSEPSVHIHKEQLETAADRRLSGKE